MISSAKSLDLRVRRTHKLLWDAFLTLLAERDFDTITVKEICDRAMVHRTTFYKHYEDKYDLLTHGMQETFDLLLSELEQTGKDTSSYARFFEHVATHEGFYRVMLCGNGIGSFQSRLRNYVAETITTEMVRQERLGYRSAVPVAVLAQFYAGALVSTLTWWLSQDRRASPDQMGHYVRCLIETPARADRRS